MSDELSYNERKINEINENLTILFDDSGLVATSIKDNALYVYEAPMREYSYLLLEGY